MTAWIITKDGEKVRLDLKRILKMDFVKGGCRIIYKDSRSEPVILKPAMIEFT